HLLASVGISGVMGIMAGVSAVGIVLTLVALPEPKGQTLEAASAEIEPELVAAAEPEPELAAHTEPEPELAGENASEEGRSLGGMTGGPTGTPRPAGSLRA
ncbi:MAG: hypothetical protein ACYCVO_07425, partial [Acidimicrobiales bacterium]